MIRHVIFDCFGTLINTGDGSIKAVECILSNVGASVDPRTFYAEWKKAKRRMMNGCAFRNEKTLFALSLGETFEKYGISADASVEVQPMICSLFADRVAFPDVYSTLERLKAKGLDIAIGSTTDTDSLIYYLDKNNIRIPYIYTSEDMQVYKPDAGFYETILKRTGWKAEECLFVGDSYGDDVKGPKTAGMKSVLVDRKGICANEALNPAPDYIVRSLEELDEIL